MSKKREPQMLSSTDNGDRRSGVERRKFSYTLHLPERRNGGDRRAFENHPKTSSEKQVDEPLTL